MSIGTSRRPRKQRSSNWLAYGSFTFVRSVLTFVPEKQVVLVRVDPRGDRQSRVVLQRDVHIAVASPEEEKQQSWSAEWPLGSCSG